MKYLLLLLLIPVVTFSQNIPNGSFESWHVPGNYENPVSWDTPNDVTAALSIYPVLKESNMVKEGAYSAHLQTRLVMTSKVPGLVCLGDFSVNILTSQITLGAGPAFTHKPTHFRGWYIYDPKSGDECYIAAFLLKQNGSSYDTLARAEFQTTQQNLTWKEFNIPFQYSSSETPTHFNVIGLSSYFFTSPQVNSALYLDGLNFEYNSSSVQMAELDRFSVNTATGMVYLPGNPADKMQLRLFDVTGKPVAQLNANEKEFLFPDIVTLKQGIYFIEIYSNGTRTVYKFKK
jgi:hypothetical protein